MLQGTYCSNECMWLLWRTHIAIEYVCIPYKWSVFWEYMHLLARDVRVAVGARLKCNRPQCDILPDVMHACVCRDINSIKST